jgi:hypothetical protein
MEQMREDLKVLEKQFEQIKKTLDEVHMAIVGNPLLNGAGGIAARLLDAEKKVVNLEDDFRRVERSFNQRIQENMDRITQNEKKQIRYNVYTVIMWACLGAVAMAIFMYILQLKK